MSKVLNEDTQVKLDLKTIGIIVGGAISLASMYFIMQADIAEAKELPTFPVSDKEIEFRDDYNSDGFIFVKQDQPLPCTVLAIYPTVVTSDG